MAAVLRPFTSASTDWSRQSSRAPRQTNGFIDRRALVDVMAVMENVHPQASDDEIWMISYMDIMTLLLTLFVLLLAFARITPKPIPATPAHLSTKHLTVKSKSEQTPAHSVAPIMKAAPVGATPVIARTAVTPPVPTASVTPRTPPVEKAISKLATPTSLINAALAVVAQADVIIPPLRPAAPNVVPLRQAPDVPEPAVPAAVAAREKLLESVRSSALGQHIELTADQENINLEISDNILFDPGSATLKQHGEQLLDELAGLLTKQDCTVSVEGHSDNVPFANARFASNWELSATRATNVTRYLIAHGIAAARLRAIGYADTRPRADNDSVQGRARNRRVSLVLHMPVLPQVTATELQTGKNTEL